jgi:hypothetical protein
LGEEPEGTCRLPDEGVRAEVDAGVDMMAEREKSDQIRSDQR